MTGRNKHQKHPSDKPVFLDVEKLELFCQGIAGIQEEIVAAFVLETTAILHTLRSPLRRLSRCDVCDLVCKLSRAIGYFAVDSFCDQMRALEAKCRTTEDNITTAEVRMLFVSVSTLAMEMRRAITHNTQK